MLANELRQAYIDFFVERGHLHLPSAPLIPIDALGVEDTSTLFTSAGMQQFKPYFTGEAIPPRRRIVTVQKCVRTGDIDSVGDYSHLTFFEMLGNFSFADYFKREVIPWTWEFLTGRLGLDPERLCVTVFHDDDEAFEIWRDVVGISPDRIHRLGEDKNYWPANAITQGPNGPCGPCTEVFYRVVPPDQMTADPSLTPTERFKIDDDAGRWLEIWNNVFTQFDRTEDASGKPVLVPLPGRNNDTGAGFERILAVIQNKASVFDTDLMYPLLERIQALARRKYTGTMGPEDFAFRVIAEHARATVFCIADGILPSNEGRGYVLRRILRRAIRFGKAVLGFQDPFLHEVAPVVVDTMGAAYPEIVERSDHILKTIYAEEERFRRTLENGTRRLEELLEQAQASGSGVLSGEDAFVLYDTFGFPIELTREIAAEHGTAVDLKGFQRSLEEQRRRSQEASEMGKDVFRRMEGALAEIQRQTPATQFEGYAASVVEAEVQAVIRNDELVDFARAGDAVEIVLDRTPFYAEAGGQVGDTGWITSPGRDTECALRAEVMDTQKAGGIILHKAVVREGVLNVGDRVTAAVDMERRRSIMRNHTATHLLHAALREVLGKHVHQKGSLVAPDRLRFDFTHTHPVSRQELDAVEEVVNRRILEDLPVVVHEDLPIAEARRHGAMALFGEKYGTHVRMIEVPGVSAELCGGTHLNRTAQVGLFKILMETGVAAGVRRIEAVTGEAAYRHVRRQEEILAEAAALLKTHPADLPAAVGKLIQSRAELEKQVRQMRAAPLQEPVELATTRVNGIAVVTGRLPETTSEALAALADRTAQEHKSAVVVLAAPSQGKVLFTAKVTRDLVNQGIHAGNLVREVARIAGGGGGGRADFAQAGGRDLSKLDEALEAAPRILDEMTRR
ncbi:MAG: alanine--tRNA ligase [Chthonomonadales bacterium]